MNTVEKQRVRMQPLTHREIDRRIGDLASNVYLALADPAPEAEGSLRPRWISAAELVERMRPFLVFN